MSKKIQEEREIRESEKNWQEKDRLLALGVEAQDRTGTGNKTRIQVSGLHLKVYLSYKQRPVLETRWKINFSAAN